MVGVRGRSGSGGARPNSGRRYKQIRLDYDVLSKDGVLRLYRDVILWNLEQKIEHVRARTTLIALEGLARLLMPDEIEGALNELRKQAEDARADLADLKRILEAKKRDPSSTRSCAR